MNFAKRLCVGVAAAALTASASMLAAQSAPSTSATSAPASTAPVAAAEKQGSLYLQCDGQPNNMTAGESAARLLGAITLLAILAPPPEGYDPSKRKFGADGVAACSALIEGAAKEGNPNRRIGLILARAIHNIEAKNYAAAVTDTGMARSEAAAAGLMADPYYLGSQARSFELIEGAALFRMGRATEARDMTLRSLTPSKHSTQNLLSTPDYSFATRTGSDDETRYMQWRSRVEAPFARIWADRLDALARFAEAARVRDALIGFDQASVPEWRKSSWIAQAAVSYALAGEMDEATRRAAEAKANFDKRKSEGKPEDDAAEFVELMDLYGIVQTAAAGDVRTARRLFAARSQWVAASFGSVIEVNRRLRTGAAPDDLIGGLAKTPDQLWQERAEASTAELLAKDSDNATLFWLVRPAFRASSYETIAKNVWKTDKSRLLLKIKDTGKRKSMLETLFLYGATRSIAFDAYIMHAALLAKSRGQQGFVVQPFISRDLVVAGILTGNRGATGMADAVFNDADEVIADMSPIFPDPAALKARQAAATH